jgi:hypothetical protein
VRIEQPQGVYRTQQRDHEGTSASPSSAPPGWVQGLGVGITVIDPATPLPGHASPGATVRGLVDAVNTGNGKKICTYILPSVQAGCRAALSGRGRLVGGPTFRHFALGYVAVHGNKALVGTTGTVCTPGQTPRCVSNHNPAAIFTTAKPFATLWAESVAAGSKSYSLAPCAKVGTRWYIYNPPGSSGG